MGLSVFNYFWLVVSFIYGKVFHEKMSEGVTHFFKNLSYVGFGTFIGTAFLFTFNVLVGRLLGPLEYGKFSLVQSISMFLYVPMLMGYHNAMVKYNAEEEKYDRQKNVISTTYILVLIFTTISVIIYLFIPQKILEYFSVSNEIFDLCILFSVLYAVYMLLTATVNGLHKMKAFAMITPIYSTILLFTFLSIAYIKPLSYKLAIFSMLFSYLITSCLILIYIRKYLTYEFDRKWAHTLTNFAIYSIIGSMTFVLYPNINQILINMYMSTENLGLYNAYSFASVNIASLIFNIFNGVFFPVASKCKDKTVILKRINRIAPYLIIFGTIFIIIVEFIILNIYGSKYTIKIPLLFSFAILSILIVYYGTYNWTFSSEGLDGVKLVNKTSILIAIINVILAMFFIPYLGLIGATISTSIALVIGVYFLLSKGKYFKYDKI
ncbi:MAG: oligosaccharide flippase family protein [Methanosarcina flavescens]|uniref:Heteropolysaccharide repeat unit export protein n=3 Tax=Methanosarcina thermophila TaxID=2210 RepID=A0A0E3NBG7_METTT|nr:Heteropolysaccharide repeat unit export protein [Methanosarcina thermophila TM-1]AKB12950.1 Membrane protein involved in the export of O-antigen, teichoic acid lipoteichoic acids [Methanosarcina thermophila TM-1]BAW30194.1 membrane protein [Methanosarcina thermophila]HPT76670.1 oligosaccharide flippase family protein [Defluviitaleaceae bacterium]